MRPSTRNRVRAPCPMSFKMPSPFKPTRSDIAALSSAAVGVKGSHFRRRGNFSMQLQG